MGMTDSFGGERLAEVMEGDLEQVIDPLVAEEQAELLAALGE